jgi:hypothetical protein
MASLVAPEDETGLLDARVRMIAQGYPNHMK